MKFDRGATIISKRFVIKAIWSLKGIVAEVNWVCLK